MLSEREVLLQLAQRQDLLFDLLNKLPIQISNNGGEGKLRFDTYEHSSTAYTMNLDTLYYFNFRDNSRGSLIDLISVLTKKDKQEVINEIYLILVSTQGFVQVECGDYETKEFELGFPDTYPSESLDEFKVSVSRLFLRDNVWLSTQLYWGIRYDQRFKRIIIPVKQDGELVGAIGRLNKVILEDFEQKYMPINNLTYSKTKVLFGLDEYIDIIRDKKMVILVESEKSVMKAWQYRLPYPVLAVGSSNISRHHIERLNLLGVTKIIWAQDKGIDERTVLLNNMYKLRRYSTAKSLWFLDSDSCDMLDDKDCFLDKDFNDIPVILKNYTKNIKELEGEFGQK